MVGWNSLTPNDERSKIPIPTVTGLCIGAVAGAVAWLIIYRLCPKPPLVDKILGWVFTGRRAPHERPTTTAMTLDGNGWGGPSSDNIGLQNHQIRRRGSPTQTIETIMFESEHSTPEPPLFVSSEEESD